MADIISLTGDLGGGKSTVSSILCKSLHYDYIYTGAIQRKIAERYNMTTTELNQYSEQHPEIDEEIDSTFKSLNNASDLIVDSRLAWFFIPGSFKVFLKTSLAGSVERITKDKERKNENYASIEDATRNIIERKNSENKRYKELYGADCSNLHNFNLLIDTSFISPERVAEIILKEYNNWQKTQINNTLSYISPLNLYPTQSIKDLGNKCTKELLNNGFDVNSPVDAVHFNSFDYIIDEDGHKKVCCALQNHIDLIPVNYLDGNSLLANGLTYNDAISNSLKLNFVSDWEDFNSFKFLSYP